LTPSARLSLLSEGEQSQNIVEQGGKKCNNPRINNQSIVKLKFLSPILHCGRIADVFVRFFQIIMDFRLFDVKFK
jgi:hypothetical protein